MSFQVLAPDAQPCVWMCAGLISYKLCNRDFDCENCPLDAALHGDLPAPPPVEVVTATPSAAEALPRDRRYSAGHTWVQPVPDGEAGLFRVGVDAFAAAIIGSVVGLRCHCPERVLERGDLICDLDLGLGTLSLGSPVRGRIMRGNPGLREVPDQALAEPYGEGWIAEMTDVDPAQVEELATAETAIERTRHDLTRFRRDVALRLFTDLRVGALGWSGAGERLIDLRQILGRVGYLELVAEFVR